jgi:hypothetical protein
MRVKSACIVCLLVILSLTASAVAQEGHPMTGTWYGDFGSTKDKRNDLTVIMNWDGKTVTGIVNPGPGAVQIKVATLDSSKWTVHFEAEAKNKAGGMDRFVFDGKMADVVSFNRTITGTWSCGATKGDFRIQRD